MKINISGCAVPGTMVSRIYVSEDQVTKLWDQSERFKCDWNYGKEQRRMDRKITDINSLMSTSISHTDSLAHCVPTSVKATELCSSICSCLYTTAVSQNVMA